MYACVLSHFSHIRLFATQWTVAHQAPLYIGFSRQEYWRGLPCPSPGDLPDSEIEPWSLLSPPLEGGFFTTGTTFGGIKDFFNENKLYKRLLYILMLKEKKNCFCQS